MKKLDKREVRIREINKKKVEKTEGERKKEELSETRYNLTCLQLGEFCDLAQKDHMMFRYRILE